MFEGNIAGDMNNGEKVENRMSSQFTVHVQGDHQEKKRCGQPEC